MDGSFVNALVAGLAVALAAGPLGCFVAWRRMAYFGDATSHAAILGIALALILSVSPFFGVLALAVAVALTVTALSGRFYATDTILGVLAHSGLALGMVSLALVPGALGGDGAHSEEADHDADTDLHVEDFLFGDIMAVSGWDLALIVAGASLVAGLMLWRWSALLTVTMAPELARASGLRPVVENLVLNLGLALLVAAAFKVVGALLITALMVIPAGAARPWVRGPEAMALLAAAIAAVSVACGLGMAVVLETPEGPSIVSFAAAFFVASAGVAVLRRG